MGYKNENMIEKAIMFAVMAHSGQVRKGDGKTPYITHPLNVAQILIEYGAKENVIIAAYLHDIPEDTRFDLDDIKRLFGERVAHLVEVATEKDKSKSWEERKYDKIKSLKNTTLEEKLVPIADKISNIEELNRNFRINGERDFSKFRRGKSEQEWYFRSVYEAFCENEDENNSLLVRLKEGINSVFGRTMEEYEKSGDKKKMQKIIEDSIGIDR